MIVKPPRLVNGLKLVVALGTLLTSRVGAQGVSPKPIDAGLGTNPRPLPPNPVPPAVALEQLRTAYAAAYNRRDAIAVAALYSSDAVVIGTDGALLRGREDIQRALLAKGPTWGRITITPLNTPESSERIGPLMAWSVGTVVTEIAAPRSPSEAGSAVEKKVSREITRYLLVTSAEAGAWKIKAVASTPVAHAVERGAPETR